MTHFLFARRWGSRVLLTIAPDSKTAESQIKQSKKISHKHKWGAKERIPFSLAYSLTDVAARTKEKDERVWECHERQLFQKPFQCDFSLSDCKGFDRIAFVDLVRLLPPNLK